MVYDANAQKLGVKAIATVESNNTYDSINYNDPITVGVVQWFGTRAANILSKLKTANVSGSWTGVALSLENAMKTNDVNSPYWNSRYLTTVEGNSIKPVLLAGKTIQNEQIVADFEVYKAVAISYGFNPDTNTDTVLFFFTMHHQSPAAALEVVKTLQTTATLTQIFNATLANPTLGQYVNRYTTAKNIIAAHDSSGIVLPGTPTAPPKPVVGGSDEANTASSLKNLSYADLVGSSLMLHFTTGDVVTLYTDGRGRFLTGGATVPTVEPVPPVVPPVTPPPPVGDWFHPLPGSIVTSEWGPRGWDGVGYFHWGIDFSSPGGAGTTRAVTDMVISVATDSGEPSGGTYVKGHSLDGKYTFVYYHMVYGSLRVKVGDTLSGGAVLGTEGATGNVTGRHTHFEIYNGNLVDPWPPPYGPESINPRPILVAHGVKL